VLLDGLSGPNLQAANGPQRIFPGLIAGNVLEPEQAGIVRALAYDRNGNGGDGSFWTGNFESSIFEIDTAGDVLRGFPNAGVSSHGFGIDPTSDGTLMWINGLSSGRKMAEYDLSTGTLTGKTMDGLYRYFGGLDVVPGSLGRGPQASGYDILYLQSSYWNQVRGRRLHLDVAGQGIPPSPTTRLGTREPDLWTTVNDAQYWPPSDRGVTEYVYDNCLINPAPVLNVLMDISRNPGDGAGTGGLNGTPAVVFLNTGDDAARGVDATSNLLNIRELAHLQPLLTSPSAQFAVRSRGLVLSNDPMASATNEWRIQLPMEQTWSYFRVQGLWIDQDVPFLPIALTNQARFRRYVPGILGGTYAVCLGNNTFNADTSAGYFQVINEETCTDMSIVRVTYSINFGDPNISATTQNLIDEFFRWDTDNPNMAEVFAGGNSMLADCLGTYRNESEVTTGLIFAGTPQQNERRCDPSAMQGWIGSVDGPTAYGSANGDYLQLDFQFTPDTFLNGAKFEFDADTDGGPGVNGSSMAGVIVEVEFKNGRISTAEITPDANVPFRAFAQL
ncbi:MAG: hypothetical protein ACYTG5_12500, partial [Planctomycetota bacterium]